MAETDSVPHPRQLIRSAVVALLAGKTGAGRNVYDSRDLPLTDATLPGILVYTLGERIDRDQLHDDGTRRRTMDLSIEVYGSGDGAAEQTDRIAWQVENILRGDPSVGGRAERVDFLDSASVFADNGQMVLFVTTMTVEVVFWTHLAPEDGERPTRVMLGFAPDIGPGNEDSYSEITGK